jgi:imidazolonepropionase-like amidohydrolase
MGFLSPSCGSECWLATTALSFIGLRHCGCSYHADQLSVIADGADAVRKAVREELRRGASHIKIMASGWVASPTDPLDRWQYSDDEIRAAVEEADRAGFYVAAHCHPKEAVRRGGGPGGSVDRALRR